MGGARDKHSRCPKMYTVVNNKLNDHKEIPTKINEVF